MKPSWDIPLPGSRSEALARLESFLPEVERYAERRNHVVPGHGNVSLLSPATRTRLLLETEICRRVRDRFPAPAGEKFEQEVWWRLYWKGWLEQRPGVWDRYRAELAETKRSDRALQVAAGESGVEIMDHFARELISTGYLHNHARMWWAAFWIHVERLPWVLGAELFLQHLLDGDAASNTLSWRWVAGLHTKGKEYLVRRSNLEKFVHADLLRAYPGGLDRLENVSPAEIPFSEPPPPLALEEEPLPASLPERYGIWLHDEDLLPEHSPLARTRPVTVGAFLPGDLWTRENYSMRKTAFLERAVRDGSERAEAHFGVPSVFETAEDLGDRILAWARENDLRAVLAMRPFVGPLSDRIGSLREKLSAAGIDLILVRRPEEVPVLNRATAGFFGFWKKTAALRTENIGSLPLFASISD